jgi:putative ABC transport system permease protein
VPDQKTIITAQSVVLAFGISVGVGILFGIYPARRASLMDPIDALRHE